jgi:hypothetical protein
MTKLLVVYNMCGLSGRDNSHHYIPAIDSIVSQAYGCPSFQLVLSGCMMLPETKETLQAAFGKPDDISYNWIDEKLPINVTFNHSVMKAWKAFGPFAGVVYLDSGIVFTEPDQLAQLYELMMAGNGIVAARTDSDTGLFQNLGIGRHIDDFQAEAEAFSKGPIKLKVGQCVNLHCQIFSQKFVETYDCRLMCDIFEGYCTESVYDSMCRAIEQDYIIHNDVVVHHETWVDGQSAGFHPSHHIAKGGKTWDQPFRSPRSIVEIAKAGRHLGLVYEQSQGIVLPDPAAYDGDKVKNPAALARYIRENLNLPKKLLDYNTIQHDWNP